MSRYLKLMFGSIFCVLIILIGYCGANRFDHESSSSSESTYVLVGSEGHYAYFNVTLPNSCEDLTTIEFEFVEFDPETLLMALEKCTKLENLHLHEVEWVGNFDRRITLPMLKNFILYRARDYHEADKNNLKSILFFNQNNGEDWDVEQIGMLGINIEMDHFLINHSTGEIQSTLPFTQELIRNLQNNGKFMIKHLTLEHISMPLELFPTSLESLEIVSVLIPGRVMLDEIFRKTVNLKHLVITSTMPNMVDFSYLPTSTLESLSLTSVELAQNKAVQFTKLQMLKLSDCVVYPEIIPSTLKILELDDTLVSGGRINEIFSRPIMLEELTIRRPTPFALDISNIAGQNLKKMHFENIHLYAQNSILNIKSFPKVKIFICHDCNLDSVVIKNFATMFPNVQFYDLWFRNTNIPIFWILEKIISNSNSKRIEITDMDRHPGQMAFEKQKDSFVKIQKLLEEAGVPDEEMTFILEFNEKNRTWIYLDPFDENYGRF